MQLLRWLVFEWESRREMMAMSGNGGMAGISGEWARMRAVWNVGILQIWRLRWTRKLVYIYIYILTAVVVMIDSNIRRYKGDF